MLRCFAILSMCFEQMFVCRGWGWGDWKVDGIMCYLLRVSSGNLLLQIHVMRRTKINSILSKA